MLPINFDLLSYFDPQAGLGDLKLSLKIRAPFKNENNIFQMALLSALSVPTGNGNKNSGYFPRSLSYIDKNVLSSDSVTKSGYLVDYSLYTAQKPELLLDALWTIDLDYVLFHINSGLNLPFNSNLDNSLLLAAGIEVHPTSWFAFTTDAGMATRFYNVKNGFKVLDDPFWISPGINFTSSGGMTCNLTGSFSLSSNKDITYALPPGGSDIFRTAISPKWKIGLQLGWSHFFIAADSDNDGIRNKDDACPNDAEDVDGYEDSDGCPDLDNDHDGVPDSLDKCPMKPEDMDGYTDDDGCPELDNDNDAVADSVDSCPALAEDMDGFEDSDGCPDYDNDADGVPDTLDKCPLIPEDQDGFQDDDGCPDIDNDMDAIADSIDPCPDQAGVADEQGCPKQKTKAKEINPGRVILRGVEFETGTAILRSTSYAILDRVYESLEQWPEIQIEIRGHTDNSIGRSAAMALSQKRADAVKNYLTGRGVAARRLLSVGKGYTEPIADNSSFQGKQMNNRIEIYRQN